MQRKLMPDNRHSRLKEDRGVLNPRVGVYYILGALIVAPLAFLALPWTAILIWPALALACIGVSYFGPGGAVYRKRNGRVPLAMRILLAPVYIGQVLSWSHYRHASSPWDQAVPNVLIGRVLTGAEATALIDLGVKAVIDLTAEFSETPALRALEYRNIALLDLTAPSTAQMRAAVEFIAEQVEAGNCVYIHCKVGYSRTAAIAGAYLIASGEAESVEDAISQLHAARPGIVIRPEARRALAAADKAP